MSPSRFELGVEPELDRESTIMDIDGTSNAGSDGEEGQIQTVSSNDFTLLQNGNCRCFITSSPSLHQPKSIVHRNVTQKTTLDLAISGAIQMIVVFGAEYVLLRRRHREKTPYLNSAVPAGMTSALSTSHV